MWGIISDRNWKFPEVKGKSGGDDHCKEHSKDEIPIASCLRHNSLEGSFGESPGKSFHDDWISDTVLRVKLNCPTHEFQEISPRIIGGSDATIGRYPYAQITLIWNGAHNCGGSLLAPDLVLTAAHCWRYSHKPIIEINRYNFKDDSENFETREVVGKFVHP